MDMIPRVGLQLRSASPNKLPIASALHTVSPEPWESLCPVHCLPRALPRALKTEQSSPGVGRFAFTGSIFSLHGLILPTTLMGHEVVTGIEDNGLCIAVSHQLKYSQLEPPLADVDVSGHIIIQTFLFFFKEWWLWKETIVLNSPSSVQSCCGDLALETSFPVSLSPITDAQCFFSTIQFRSLLHTGSFLCVQDFIHHVNSYYSAPSLKMKTASGRFIISVLQHVFTSSVLPSQHQTTRIWGWEFLPVTHTIISWSLVRISGGEDYVVLKMSQNEVRAAGSMLWEGGHPCLPPPTHVTLFGQ